MPLSLFYCAIFNLKMERPTYISNSCSPVAFLFQMACSEQNSSGHYSVSFAVPHSIAKMTKLAAENGYSRTLRAEKEHGGASWYGLIHKSGLIHDCVCRVSMSKLYGVMK